MRSPTCNSDSGYIINTGALLKAEESERQPVHQRRGFLVWGLCVVSDWGQIMETPCTLWCQWSTSGRLHNKSHCVFSSAHLQAGCGAFLKKFFFIHTLRKCEEKHQHKMVTCSLNLRAVKSSIRLVRNIICCVCERSVVKRNKRNKLTGNVLSDICTSMFFFISVSDWSPRRTVSFFFPLFLYS